MANAMKFVYIFFHFKGYLWHKSIFCHKVQYLALKMLLALRMQVSMLWVKWRSRYNFDLINWVILAQALVIYTKKTIFANLFSKTWPPMGNIFHAALSKFVNFRFSIFSFSLHNIVYSLSYEHELLVKA